MNSFQIGRIMGIPVRLHITFLIIIPWVALVFATISERILGNIYGFGSVDPALTRYVYSFAVAILLFACVALHEIGHSYVARTHGIEIKSITLYLFGGVSAMEEIPRNPRLEFLMAFAGPAVSGLIGAACILLYFPVAARIDEHHPFLILLWTLGIINIILMAFNLLPAFPMDGGRLLRAWLATRMPYIAATRRAASLGKMFAVLMSIVAIFSFQILLLIVAFFIYIGASEEEKATAIDLRLEGFKVSDIMSPEVRTVESSTNLADLTDLMFREKHRGYPVMEGDALRGIVTLTDVQKVPPDARVTTTVGDVMARQIYVIGPNEEASAAMKKMTERGIRRLPVIDGGRLIGILSREDLVRTLELSSE